MKATFVQDNTSKITGMLFRPMWTVVTAISPIALVFGNAIGATALEKSQADLIHISINAVDLWECCLASSTATNLS